MVHWSIRNIKFDLKYPYSVPVSKTLLFIKNVVCGLHPTVSNTRHHIVNKYAEFSLWHIILTNVEVIS